MEGRDGRHELEERVARRVRRIRGARLPALGAGAPEALGQVDFNGIPTANDAGYAMREDGNASDEQVPEEFQPENVEPTPHQSYVAARTAATSWRR